MIQIAFSLRSLPWAVWIPAQAAAGFLLVAVIAGYLAWELEFNKPRVWMTITTISALLCLVCTVVAINTFVWALGPMG